MKQQVRIIGGKFRGKKIDFPEAQGLRPTPDRVRETLFNWLMHDIRGARCLDAFAGSGALGFEAFSRGAAHVTLVEQNRLVFNHLLTVSRAFNAPELSVIHADALAFLSTTRETFDLVFLDPPFAHACHEACFTRLQASDCLPPGGLVYVESPESLTLNPAAWQALKSKQAGHVFYALYKKMPSN
ncbi:16S rRNA (guanine(966)-N(2))-methyltransferase RsmD [Legionella erythra]|uniref:Ribosomal RNA small subunit methyltransferase D n=1 Tax=Legionella erythra TaxID=448 RepID=A0A0W0TU48_LEGER|nr:16S rRNA (guanine(966)-N(2))-methyltransferase RsmD [Legionella erythra]KTC99133.1 methyltransferase [Legionella erythra]